MEDVLLPRTVKFDPTQVCSEVFSNQLCYLSVCLPVHPSVCLSNYIFSPEILAFFFLVFFWEKKGFWILAIPAKLRTTATYLPITIPCYLITYSGVTLLGSLLRATDGQ